LQVNTTVGLLLHVRALHLVVDQTALHLRHAALLGHHGGR